MRSDVEHRSRSVIDPLTSMLNRTAPKRRVDIRKELRAFDLAYRIGGEEFLILLPGADAEGCQT
jgi:hypothetical protein